MFSCEFCEISKNTFFTEHLATASGYNYSPNTLSVISEHSERIFNSKTKQEERLANFLDKI